MASYRGHLTFSTMLGAVYGSVAAWKFNVPWPVAGVGGLMTALGGLLPDLDSASGVPVRELFGLAGAFIPMMMLREASVQGFTPEQTLLAFAGLYFGIRFLLAEVFRQLTVHRGMFHSLPAMLIVGLLVFLGYRHPEPIMRAYLAIGAMVGFLSHLVLDEFCAVDFKGVVPKLNAFAGSALKMRSKSLSATGFTYSVMFGLMWLVWSQHRHELAFGLPDAKGQREPPTVSISPKR